MDWLTDADDRYQLVQERPAVIVVEVVPGQPLGIETSGDDLPEISFALIVDVNVIERVDSLHPNLRAALAELIATDVEGSDEERARNAADKALEQWGFGPDYVFTMPLLEDALIYTSAAVDSDRAGFDADAVMVVGPVGTAERARNALGMI